MFLTKKIPSYPKDIHLLFNKWSSTKELVFVALLGALATILQAAGGLLPGIGFFISPLTTAPIVLGMLISFRSGVLTYFLTICLLFMVQPSELFVFPFTTGLLGLGLGFTLRTFTNRLGISFINGLILFVGICIPLYVLQFPVFGPVSTSFNIGILTVIFLFSTIYSMLWLELGLYLLRKMRVILFAGK